MEYGKKVEAYLDVALPFEWEYQQCNSLDRHEIVVEGGYGKRDVEAFAPHFDVIDTYPCGDDRLLAVLEETGIA